MRRRKAPPFILPSAMVAMVLGAMACAVSPARLDGDPKDAPVYTFSGPHGRPLAFGGDVCPILNPHLHHYSPVPSAAFVRTKAGFEDRRQRYPYRGMHAHHRRTCTRSDWHWHLEPPQVGMKLDPRVGAFSEAGEEKLTPYPGHHPPGACGRARRCEYGRDHAHVSCP